MQSKGFSLLELMIGVAVAGILLMIGVPALSQFTVSMRVDKEIGDINRALLAARNNAINNGVATTVCPLDSGNDCSTNWKNQVSVFSDVDGDKKFEAADGDTILLVKNPSNNSDSLTNSRAGITYSPDGTTIGALGNGTFIYCPKGYAKSARAVTVSRSGRAKKSIDTNGDGTDNHPSTNAELSASCPST